MMWKLVFSGVGGQGIISAGILLAEAAVIEEGRFAVQTQSYGAEMRGGLSRSDVTIADSEILYPKVEQAHLLVAMHQKALSAALPVMRPGGILVTDSDQVTLDRRTDARYRELPIERRIREASGSTRNANICMLGAVVALSECVHIDALRAAVIRRFGESVELQEAIDLGVELAQT